MPEKQPIPDWNLSERDTIILQELARDPQLTSRGLRDLLAEEHDIDVSHVTVNESIRRMRADGVFREALVPNEEHLFFSLFEFQFNPEGFDEHWEDALEHIRSSRHTFMYFLSDGDYQWKTIMMFEDREQESKWIHEFYKGVRRARQQPPQLRRDERPQVRDGSRAVRGVPGGRQRRVTAAIDSRLSRTRRTA